MTPAERGRAQQSVQRARRDPARHRRGVGRPESSSPLPRGHPLRAAVEPVATRAARGARRPAGPDPPRTRAGARRRAHGRTARRRAARHPPRRHRTTRGRMLDALTESRVAAAVMTTRRSPARVVVEETAARPDYAVPPPDGLAAHAVREAARLEHHRSLAARSSPGPEPDAGWRGVASSTRTPHARASRTVLWCSRSHSLRTDGATIHAEALDSFAASFDRIACGQLEGSAAASLARRGSRADAVIRSRPPIARSPARARPSRGVSLDSKHSGSNGCGNGRRPWQTCSLPISRPRRGCWCRRVSSIADPCARRRCTRRRPRHSGARWTSASSALARQLATRKPSRAHRRASCSRSAMIPGLSGSLLSHEVLAQDRPRRAPCACSTKKDVSRRADVSAPGTCRCARSSDRRWRSAPSSIGSANPS